MSTVIKRRADTLGSTSQILAVEKGKEKVQYDKNCTEFWAGLAQNKH